MGLTGEHTRAQPERYSRCVNKEAERWSKEQGYENLTKDIFEMEGAFP